MRCLNGQCLPIWKISSALFKYTQGTFATAEIDTVKQIVASMIMVDCVCVCVCVHYCVCVLQPNQQAHH